jgi:hypothetical protein
MSTPDCPWPRELSCHSTPRPAGSIPEEPQCVTHAAFPKGTLCLRIADELGPLYRDDLFADLFPTRGQPAASPARLAFASMLQYVEGLSDRQAADGVGGLAIVEPLGELEDRHQGQPPRGLRWLPEVGEQGGKALVLVEDTQAGS